MLVRCDQSLRLPRVAGAARVVDSAFAAAAHETSSAFAAFHGTNQRAGDFLLGQRLSFLVLGSNINEIDP